MIDGQAGSSRSRGWVVRGAAVCAVTAALGTAGPVAASTGDPGRTAGAHLVVLVPATSAPLRPASRALRLREFRDMVVAQYRIRGDGAAPGGDPIAQLWRQLAREHA